MGKGRRGHPSVQLNGHWGAHIRVLRNDRDMTAKALAEQAGISRQTLHDLENKQGFDPHLSTLVALRDALELSSIEALFGPFPSMGLRSEGQEDHGSAR